MADAFETIAAHLDALTRSGRYLNAGLARIDARGEVARVFGRVAPDGPTLTDSTLRMRMASISKAATARAVVMAAADGAVALDGDIRDLLGLDLPRAVTLDHLLSHTSGLTDHAGYIVDPPASVAAFVAAHPTVVAPEPPGAFFRYANLNYILLGMALERVRGARFDRILGDVLAPAGIAGGFNWTGVTERRALAVWQRQGERLTCQADGPGTDWAADLIWRGGAGVALDDYRIGEETTLFSPHAGLRMTVAEAARLARMLGAEDDIAREQRRVRWRFDGTNGEDCDGLFPAFGAGVTLYDGDARIPGPLVGHAGHALGFTGGAWANTRTGTAWAYFLNGSPDMTEGQDEEAFYDPDEAAIMLRF